MDQHINQPSSTKLALVADEDQHRDPEMDNVQRLILVSKPFLQGLESHFFFKAMNFVWGNNGEVYSRLGLIIPRDGLPYVTCTLRSLASTLINRVLRIYL